MYAIGQAVSGDRRAQRSLELAATNHQEPGPRVGGSDASCRLDEQFRALDRREATDHGRHARVRFETESGARGRTIVPGQGGQVCQVETERHHVKASGRPYRYRSGVVRTRRTAISMVRKPRMRSMAVKARAAGAEKYPSRTCP